MKRIFVAVTLLAALNAQAQPGSDSGAHPELKDKNDSLNYFLGINLGFSLGTAVWDTDAEMIARGIARVLEGNPGIDQLSSQTIFADLYDAYVEALQKAEADATAQAEAEFEAKAEKNLEASRAFLEENGKKKGVYTTGSGLQFKILKGGDGPVPADSSIVEVLYEGSLIDGTVFDGNFHIGTPMSFRLDRVIRGWTEALQLMPVGATYEFYIPPELAYGERGAGPIPPNSVLIFKVELKGIK